MFNRGSKSLKYIQIKKQIYKMIAFLHFISKCQAGVTAGLETVLLQGLRRGEIFIG